MAKVRHVDLYPDEWIAGTVNLGNAERGLYITACCLIYSNGGPVRRDHLRAACRDHGHAFTRQLAVLIEAGKLTENDGQISNKRSINELQKAEERAANARQNGDKGGRPPKNTNGLENRQGFFSEKLTTNYQPPTINQKEEKAPQGAEFAAWYAAYPRKVARAKAEKAYAVARQKASADDLLRGIERYRQCKPAYADWKHPATWLNGECWLDDWAEPQAEGHDDGPKGPPPNPEDIWPKLSGAFDGQSLRTTH